MNKLILLAILTLSGIICQAQNTGRNAIERVSNRKQIAESKKMLARDIPELAAFEKNYKTFQVAFIKRDFDSMTVLQDSMHLAMQREVEQGAEKAIQARRELAAARSEVRSDRRETRDDKSQAGPGGQYSQDDQDDLRRDQYNQADDRMDAIDDNIQGNCILNS